MKKFGGKNKSISAQCRECIKTRDIASIYCPSCIFKERVLYVDTDSGFIMGGKKQCRN